MEDLKLRLELLEESGIISRYIYEKLIEFMNLLVDKYKLVLDDNNASMLFTHIAMALKRMDLDSKINSVDSEQMENIKKTDKYLISKEILEELNNNILEKSIPEYEHGYILAHIITILS